jgi:hypothetical protein
MYAAKQSNIFYTQKKIGTPTEKEDKCILGWAILALCLAITVGPLIIFSNIGGFVAPNYVHSGEAFMSFVINHDFTMNDLNRYDHHYNATTENRIFQDEVHPKKKSSKTTINKATSTEDKEHPKMSNQTMNKRYFIYSDKTPFIYNYSDQMRNESGFN